MLRYKCRNFFLSCLIFFCGVHEASAVRVECLNKTKAPHTKENEALFKQVILYLKKFHNLLSSPMKGCKRASVLISTDPSISRKQRTKCVGELDTVMTQLKHVKAVIDNPKVFRKCFDPMMNGLHKDFRGLTPHKNMINQSKVAKKLGRSTAKKLTAPAKLRRHIDAYAKKWKDGLKYINNKKGSRYNFGLKDLKDLWMSAAWIPFYVSREDAGSAKFRGGYYYTEIAGAYGMLRIKSINGELFDHEIGLTNQRKGTFYQGHYHKAQELYATIADSKCEKSQEFFVFDTKGKKYTRSQLKKFYAPTSTKVNPIAFIESGYLHSFNPKTCPDGTIGFISVWMRTGVLKGDQKTYMYGQP
ncbi:hypothetical protein OAK75_02125 [Bacteriovoracales bacterium]|nr:hypothetical protein [Bacteriovoracales bacterium]